MGNKLTLYNDSKTLLLTITIATSDNLEGPFTDIQDITIKNRALTIIPIPVIIETKQYVQLRTSTARIQLQGIDNTVYPPRYDKDLDEYVINITSPGTYWIYSYGLASYTAISIRI